MATAILAVKIVSDAKQAQRDLDKLGARIGTLPGRALRAGAGLAGGLALGSVIKDSVKLEAAFSKTMATLQASSGATGKEVDQLRALAMKLGADTAFSANEAADAMLELSKAGISTESIMEGAADGTLLLATAGGTDLATAATIASNAMNTFNLEGKDMGTIAAALAGGANASSASVESLGQALQQVGPGATNAGLSLQETVAALSAFDAAGIKGSDAGTSLKTMLARLVPQTQTASKAMEAYGLSFVNADGSIKSLTQVSDILQKKLGGLSQAERISALQRVFGSDATRAATVLMNQGAKGIQKYITATNDQEAAQRMADAAMSGTSGALERLSGAVETAKLALGQALAPIVVIVANFLANRLAPALTKAAQFMADHETGTKRVAAALGIALTAFVAVKIAIAAYRTVVAAALAVQTLWNGSLLILRARLLAIAAGQKLVVAGQALWATAQWALNAAMAANPLGLIVLAIAAVVTVIVLIVKKTSFFQKVWDKAMKLMKSGASAALGFLRKNWPKILAILTGPIGLAVLLIVKNWEKIKAAGRRGVEAVVSAIKAIPNKIRQAGAAFLSAGKFLMDKIVSGLKKVGSIGQTIGKNLWNGIAEGINKAIKGLNDFLPNKIPIKGLPDIDLPNDPIPPLPTFATGARFTGATFGIMGEGSEAETLFPDSKLRDFLRAMTAAATQNLNGGTVHLSDASLRKLAEYLAELILQGSARVSRGVVAAEARRLVTAGGPL